MANIMARPFARIAVAGIALLAGLEPSAAQTRQPADPSQAEVSVHESGFTIRSQVNLASVPVVVRNTFDVTPGIYLVRLVVRDAESQVMASRNTMVEIP